MLEEEVDLRNQYGIDPTELNPVEWPERIKAKLGIIFATLGAGGFLYWLSQTK